MVKNNSIGLMQGRLTPSRGRGIQFFPFGGWQKEFWTSKKIGLNEIEFIFDFYKFRQNPLWSKKGRKLIRSLIKETGIKVNSICADYFIHRPFFRTTKSALESNIRILKHLIYCASDINAKLIEIPLVDDSSIKNAKEETMFVDVITKFIPDLEKHKVRIGLETDLPPKKFASLIRRINNPKIGANYDSGNSSSMGYNPVNEMEEFGKYIFNIHIKDRVYKGGTVPLGFGDAKFKVFFRALHKLRYNGSFILQAARGKDGAEMETIKSQIDFLKKI